MNLKKTDKLIIGIGGIILVIMIAIVSSYAVNKSGLKNLEKEALKYIEEEEFGPASTIYSRLYTKTGDEVYKQKKEDTINLMSESKIYARGLEKLEEGDYLSAIKIFGRIEREESEYYKLSKQKLEQAEETVLSEVRKAIEDDNVYLASSILQDYVKFAGESEKTKELLEKVSVASGDAQEPEDESNTDVKVDIKTEKLPEDPSKWIGKTVEIKAERSNLRAEPSLDGQVVGLAVSGDAIQITKVKNDGARIWCYGTITKVNSGKTLQAWISGKLLQ
ncbi:MAG: SH3 domain-containing protein [Lagierella massiliensis]|nr:SH3 domain-containing protein [Lagierella massiliensis]